MQPSQQGVVDEKKELDEKIDKLSKFFETDIFVGLDDLERSRLRAQYNTMLVYSIILGERIAAFK